MIVCCLEVFTKKYLFLKVDNLDINLVELEKIFFIFSVVEIFFKKQLFYFVFVEFSYSQSNYLKKMINKKIVTIPSSQDYSQWFDKPFYVDKTYIIPNIQ